MDRLSERERLVVAFLAQGLTVKHIAREMALAPRTVERHIEDSRHKLGARNTAQLVATVLTGERGLAYPPEPMLIEKTPWAAAGAVMSKADPPKASAVRTLFIKSLSSLIEASYAGSTMISL